MTRQETTSFNHTIIRCISSSLMQARQSKSLKIRIPSNQDWIHMPPSQTHTILLKTSSLLLSHPRSWWMETQLLPSRLNKTDTTPEMQWLLLYKLGVKITKCWFQRCLSKAWILRGHWMRSKITTITSTTCKLPTRITTPTKTTYSLLINQTPRQISRWLLKTWCNKQAIPLSTEWTMNIPMIN